MRRRTYELYSALQRREIQLEKIMECVGESDKFFHLYALELENVIEALSQIDVTTEI